MKQLFFAFCFLIMLPALAQGPQTCREIGNLVVENVPSLSGDLASRVDQYQNVRFASFADWNRDGKGIFISTRFGNVAQIHHVAAPGADRQQITFLNEPITSAAVCPDKSKNGFLFSRDNGGNENYQIYYFDLTDGQTRLLTDGQSRNLFQGWNKSGTHFAFTSNQRSKADMDLYLLDFNSQTSPVRLAELKGGGWGVAAWSDDARQMILINYISINESELYRFDVGSRKMERLHLTDKPISYSWTMEFSTDNKGLYLLSDEDTEFRTLRYMDLATGKQTALTTAIPWDPEGLQLSNDGSKLLFSTNEGGYSKLYLLNAQTRQYKPISNLPTGVLGSWKLNDDGRQLAMTYATAQSSGDVYVLDLVTNALTRWTFSESGGLNPASFVEPKLIHYPTFDLVDNKPRMIPAFIYKPKNATVKTPVLLDIHGGPEGQTRPISIPFTNLLVNELGVTVIKPNVRGSSGYGKTYVKLDNGPKREDSVKDIGALLDWIAQQPDLDASRVAVLGGSYGGYMSLATMTNYNDRMRCGIDLFGISNFVTMLQNTSSYRADLRRAEYGDERDPAMQAVFEQISPIRKIRNITRPMLVFQGKNDPRVPLSESEQMVAALKKQGNTTWYIMAKDEGHGITKKANRDYVYGAIMLFLQEHLLGGSLVEKRGTHR